MLATWPCPRAPIWSGARPNTWRARRRRHQQQPAGSSGYWAQVECRMASKWQLGGGGRARIAFNGRPPDVSARLQTWPAPLTIGGRVAPATTLIAKRARGPREPFDPARRLLPPARVRFNYPQAASLKPQAGNSGAPQTVRSRARAWRRLRLAPFICPHVGPIQLDRFVSANYYPSSAGLCGAYLEQKVSRPRARHVFCGASRPGTDEARRQ